MQRDRINDRALKRQRRKTHEQVQWARGHHARLLVREHEQAERVMSRHQRANFRDCDRADTWRDQQSRCW